ncbi:putative leucine-rich repeat receptor-like protein kinase [Dorcoceras hygrometricum]|uniref:Putative leucine-rich repeat receptor-like protein kinase n=1 Tax=Dorcoceras hygrometricum TaxID=472368 RepID=A0A2Z7DBH7_9LAMI|nr:putative leucine-rich repeat receptor-like protein kinase [Dorcoceras hygrometricum]
MPPRRGRSRHSAEGSRALDIDKDVHRVDDVTRRIGEMELVLARFQRTNPPTFAATDGGAKAEAWLVQMEDLFDTLEYAPEKRLKLAVLQLRDDAQRWWRGTSRMLRGFQRTNPPTFAATDGGAKAEAWLVQMEDLFDTLEYAPEKRLKLAVLQLRDDAQRWWRGTSRMLRCIVLGICFRFEL